MSTTAYLHSEPQNWWSQGEQSFPRESKRCFRPCIRIVRPVGASDFKIRPATESLEVVDARLQVYDIEDLRVAVESIIPNFIEDNSTALAAMLGESSAVFMRIDVGAL